MWKAWYRWAPALAAGLLLRCWFLRFHTHITGDSFVYGDLATNLLRHHTFGLTEEERIRPTLIRLPGYPLLLAACFAIFGVGNYLSVIWLQIALDLAACCLLAAMAERWSGRRAGVAVLWLGALCPFTANYTVAPLTETSAVFCAALAFFALDRWWCGKYRWRWTLILGGALAFAVLLRPDRALLAVAVLAALGTQLTAMPGRRRVVALQCMAACLLIAAPLALWALRNWHTFHVFEPLAPRSATDPGESVSTGFNRWYRTWAIDFESTVDTYWSYDGSTIYMADLPDRAFDTPLQRADTAALYDTYNDVLSPTPAMDAGFATLAAQRIHGHRWRYYAVLPVARLANMWLRPRVEMIATPLDWWNVRKHPRASAGSLVYAGLNLAYLVFAVMGFLRWRRAGYSGVRPIAFALAGYVAMRSALLLTMDNSEPRYTLDCYPVIILLAGLALAAGGKRTPERVSLP